MGFVLGKQGCCNTWKINVNCYVKIPKKKNHMINSVELKSTWPNKTHILEKNCEQIKDKKHLDKEHLQKS